MNIPSPSDPEVERIVRESIARFETFLGPVMCAVAKQSGWLTEFEAEVRRVIVEARK